MLAQTFKSAKDLKLGQEVYDALVKVYWMLADEEIPAHLFRMDTIGSPEILQEGTVLCGSAGCILGWVRAVNPKLIASYESGSIGALFFPEGGLITTSPYRANRQQAARAIHNYLTTGRANWREVLKT